MPKNKEKRGGTLTASAFGGAAGVLASIALLAGAAALTASGKLPESLMREVTVLCVGLGALIGSFAAGKKKGSRTVPVGGATAALMTVAILAVSAFTDAGLFSGELTVPTLASTFAGGLSGGFLCAAPAKRRH